MKALVRVALSIPIVLVPLALDVWPTHFGRSVTFDSEASFFGAFLVAGLLAGGALGLWAVLGVPIAFVIGMVAITKAGFVGHGGDGDLFYVVAFMGFGMSMVSALVAALARIGLARAAAST